MKHFYYINSDILIYYNRLLNKIILKIYFEDNSYKIEPRWEVFIWVIVFETLRFYILLHKNIIYQFISTRYITLTLACLFLLKLSSIRRRTIYKVCWGHSISCHTLYCKKWKLHKLLHGIVCVCIYISITHTSIFLFLFK